MNLPFHCDYSGRRGGGERGEGGRGRGGREKGREEEGRERRREGGRERREERGRVEKVFPCALVSSLTTVCIEGLSGRERDGEREVCLKDIVTALAISCMSGVDRPVGVARGQQFLWHLLDALQLGSKLQQWRIST